MKKILLLWFLIPIFFSNTVLSEEVYNKDIKKLELKSLPEDLKGTLKIWEANIRQIEFSHYTWPKVGDPKDLAYKRETIIIDVYVPKIACKLVKPLNESLLVFDPESKPSQSVQFAVAETYIIEDAKKCWLVHYYPTINYCSFQSVEGLRFKDDQIVYKVLKDYPFFRANGELKLLKLPEKEAEDKHKGTDNIPNDNDPFDLE